jgi:N utilization substance protein B
MSRHRSRHRAVQVLYQVDLRGITGEQALRHYYDSLYSEECEEQPIPDEFMEELVGGTLARLEEIDRRIAQYSENWRVSRMPAVDRNIVRLAVYELLQATLPPAVIIDEAIELAHRFSGEESIGFMNGLLDAIRKDLDKTRPSV